MFCVPEGPIVSGCLCCNYYLTVNNTTMKNSAGDGGGEATLPPLERALSHSGPKLRVSAAMMGLGVSSRSEGLKGRGGDLAFTLQTPKPATCHPA